MHVYCVRFQLRYIVTGQQYCFCFVRMIHLIKFYTYCAFPYEFSRSFDLHYEPKFAVVRTT